MPRIDERTRPWWTLIGACSGLFLLMLDSTVVALALPEIGKDTGATPNGLQWVMNGYLLVIAALVVTAGRLGDMFGRKRLFQIGMVCFALGSVVSALADDEVTLILGRALQGAGAAPMLPLSLAIVCNAFPGEKQARALGIWAGVSALALGIGPLAGGALIELDWRLIFWVNLPIAALGVAITAAAAPESTDPGSGHRVDAPGLLTLSVGLTAVVLALVQSRVWNGTTTALIAGAGLVVLALFWRIEHRVANPIVDFSLFRNGPYFGASAAAFALVGAYWTVMFFQPQYLQSVRGNSAVEAGLLILPVTVPMIFISPLSGRLIARFGARRLMTAGMALGTAGLLVLTQIDAGTGYGVLMAGYLLFGVAIGLVYAPMSTAAMAAMPPEKAGIASGVLAMDRVMAGAVTLAGAGTVFHALDLHHGFSYAIARASWVLVGLTAAGTVLTYLFVRDPEEPRPHPEPPLEHRQHHRRFHL